MTFWIEQFPVFLLILVRYTAFFVAAPLFSLRGVPAQFKIGFGFFLALITFSIVASDPVEFDLAFIFYLIKEVFVGLALGFVAALLLYTIQVAGSFIDFQMGFAIANVVDPQTGAQIPIIGNFKYTMAILFLLAVDGHHLLIDAVVRSYEWVPVDMMFIFLGDEQVAYFMTSLFTKMFLIAFQIAIPIVGALFLVTVALGIVARTVPQLNVFVVGLPVQIFIGFFLLLLSLPFFFYLLSIVFEEMIRAMGQLIQLLGGS